MSDPRNFFNFFRLSDVASLAFWTSCQSAWFIQQQALGASISKLPTTTEELPPSNEFFCDKSEHGPWVNSGVTSASKIEKFIDTSEWHPVSFEWVFVSRYGTCIITRRFASWIAGSRPPSRRQIHRYTNRWSNRGWIVRSPTWSPLFGVDSWSSRVWVEALRVALCRWQAVNGSTVL